MNRIACILAAGLSLAAVPVAALAQQRPAITGIAFAKFYAADPAASQHFYGDTLGFSHIALGDDMIYPVNALQWVQVTPLKDPALPSRMAAVGFTTRNAAGLLRYLQAHGVKAEMPLAEGMFGVRDPEGNLVYFVQQGANKAVATAPSSANATSPRMIHVGYVVKDAAAEDRFYREILGFHLYWRGGRTPDRTDWVALQVPEGSDWVEYMLNIPANASLKSVGVQDHFSLGTEDMKTVLAGLQKNHCTDANCSKTQMGLDGKVQLNVFDPDLSRVEFMEYVPRQTPCCSPIVGKNPTAVEER